MQKPITPKGNEHREATAALGGYVYQVYQAALAWLELGTDEFLFLEVAEDFVVVAESALKAVQVKGTAHRVTINSNDIIDSIDSFVELRKQNPRIIIKLRHLTTSQIGKERSTSDRIGKTPTLEMWRNLARTGDVDPLRKILKASKLSAKTKEFIETLEDGDFREQFLKRIHFDCGALNFKFLKQQLQAKLIKLLQERGGVASQASECRNSIVICLLQISMQKEDRFVDQARLEKLLETATHIPVNRAQFDAHNELITKMLAASIPNATDLVSTRLAQPRPVSEVPLPSAIALRSEYISKIVSSLEKYGVGWIMGAAGVGKTIAAKLSVLRVGGNWASVNLRGLSAEQVNELLSDSIKNVMEESDINGLLIDDLECPFEPHVADKFLNLLSVCNRRDLLLLVTAPRPASSDMLFSFDLPHAIETQLDNFTEDDVKQILKSLGVEGQNWTKYIHLVSGGGHPQLAIATMQSMQQSGWDKEEFRTLDSLLIGNSQVDQVRSRTRERLLQELPEGSRRILERLSLASCGFTRSLVLDIAQVAPAVSDGGILFDQLIGSWVDQQEKDRFSLSPLLSNFASTTLTDARKETINFEIANSLIKPRRIDPIVANSALLAAWAGKNEPVLIHLCLSIIGSDTDDLQKITPHLFMLTLLRTGNSAYADNPIVSQLIRGAQLLLLCYEEKKCEHFKAALESFEKETKLVSSIEARTGMALIVYSKLLLSEPVFGPLPQFWEILQQLDILFVNQDHILPNDILIELNQNTDLATATSFMFFNQARQIKQISELVSAFEFLDTCDEKFREKVFKAYDIPEFLLDVDTLISSAWLKEHNADTINPPVHSSAYEQIENLAKSWGRQDLAVACRKYRAVIIDEYGNDKEAALSVVDEGLKIYGLTNSILIRAKAKILYRANDHQASLELSGKLIEGDSLLSETEKAFLGREAAISAEKEGDFETAKRYYLFGAVAAEECKVPDMLPMHIGLLADAAVASWHLGENETCLRELIVVLEKLEEVDSKSSLRAAHCHAVSRHLLLWLDQESTGELRYIADGEVPKIYPGIVSNPEPHPEISDRFLPPLELSWYMLAKVECHCLLDLGITQNIDSNLKNGPVREGQFLLTQAKLDKAFRLKDSNLFCNSLAETIAQFTFTNKQGSHEKSFNLKDITYGNFPTPTSQEKNALVDLTEQQILSFASVCVLDGNAVEFDAFLQEIKNSTGFVHRGELQICLLGKGSEVDYHTNFARLLALHRQAIDGLSVPSPSETIELALNILQTAKLANQLSYLSQQTLNWLEQKWLFIWEQQRFLLRQPADHESSISEALRQDEPDAYLKVLAILMGVLPTIGISNEGEIKTVLEKMMEAAPNRTKTFKPESI